MPRREQDDPHSSAKVGFATISTSCGEQQAALHLAADAATAAGLAASPSNASGGFLSPQPPTTSDGKMTASGKHHGSRRERIPEGTLCVVCEDTASGIHYSVASCNGCKTFFRRALVNKQKFQCQFSGDCVVGKSVRCVCRSCRLKKCFEMGMDPKAIQHDRDKIRYTKALRKKKEEEKAALAAAEALIKKEPATPKVKEEVGSPQSTTSDNYHNTSTPSSSNANGVEKEDFDPELMDEARRLVKQMLELEDKMLTVRASTSFTPATSATSCMYGRCLFEDDNMMTAYSQSNYSTECVPHPCTQEMLRSWFVKDLTLMMEWGKCLPIMESLLLNDKLALMKCFAHYFPLLQLAFYSSPKEMIIDVLEDQKPLTVSVDPCERLDYPDGSYILREEDGDGPPQSMYTLLMDGVCKLIKRLRLERTHIVLFKLLLFYNPNAEGLSSTGKELIEGARMKLLSLLYVWITADRTEETSTTELYSNLLLMSCTLSRVASFIKRTFDINHIFNTSNDLIDQLIIVGL